MTKSYQQQYAEILRRLVAEPNKIGDSRVGKVRSRFVEQIRVDLQKEFPLMDIKKVSFNNILHELLWFIEGNTNIKYLVDNKCNIWNDDAYRYYKDIFNQKSGVHALTKQTSIPFPPISKEEFIQKVKDGERIENDPYEVDHTNPLDMFKYYTYGDLGRVYGFQWRRFNGGTDQLLNCMDQLYVNPDDRRMIVTAHNPNDIERGIVGLPSCHNYFQFYTIPLTRRERLQWLETNNGINVEEHEVEEVLEKYNVPERYISIFYNIRSNDFFLGQPYNTPSYALLLMMVGNVVNMIPKEVVANMVDCHLYEAHMDAANEWLERYKNRFNGGDNREEYFSYGKSKVNFTRQPIDSIDEFTFDDFELTNYNPDTPIKAPLLT